MKRLGTLLYENAEGYKLFGLLAREASSQRVSAELYCITPQNKMSDIITVTRREACLKKNACEVLLDLEAGFTLDEMLIVHNEILKLFGMGQLAEFPSRQTLDEMLDVIREQIKKISESSDNPLFRDVFIEDNTGYIKTTVFDNFCRQCEDLDFKRMEVLKRLKIMGALKPGKGRAYDNSKKVNGNVFKFYCISLGEDKE